MNEKRADHFAHGMEMPDSVVDYPQIGQRIKRLRNQRGMTQEALAEATSLSVPYISHLERAVKKGSLETLTRIAAALGVTVHELLGIPRSEKEAFLPDMTSVLEDCSPEERKFLLKVTAAIKEIMSYAGPRMLYAHPLLALRYVAKKIRGMFR